MTPRRIVSLIPSLTEALFTFGVGEKVVGRTRYCTQPSRVVGRVAKAGGTKKTEPERARRVFAPIWKGSYMSVGSDTYMRDVLETCGGENVCGGYTRYPAVGLEEQEDLGLEVLLLPDEPYPCSAEDLPEFYALDLPEARENHIRPVDGKLLTWYGPSMASSLTQLAALLRF